MKLHQNGKNFNLLVESALLDIHSYSVQVNNRKYGDSRIRAPFKPVSTGLKMLNTRKKWENEIKEKGF